MELEPNTKRYQGKDATPHGYGKMGLKNEKESRVPAIESHDLKPLGMSEENSRRIKFRPKPTDTKIPKKCGNEPLTQKQIQVAFTQSHQRGYKSTKSGPHSGLYCANTKDVKSINFKKPKEISLPMDRELINTEAKRYTRGYKNTTPHKVKGSDSLLQADPDNIIRIYKRKGKENISGQGYSRGLQGLDQKYE